MTVIKNRKRATGEKGDVHRQEMGMETRDADGEMAHKERKKRSFCLLFGESKGHRDKRGQRMRRRRNGVRKACVMAGH